MTFWAPQAPKIWILPLILGGRMKKIDKFCNPAWGGEYQPLKYATKMGGRTTHSPPHYGGALSMVLDCYCWGGESSVLGGRSPPQDGGENEIRTQALAFGSIFSPPRFFVWSLLPPKTLVLGGGENAPMATPWHSAGDG